MRHSNFHEQIEVAQRVYTPFVDGRFVPLGMPELVIPDIYTAPDTYPIRIGVEKHYFPANVISVDTIGQLEEALEAYWDVTGRPRLSKPEIKRQLSHEREHGDVAKIIGAQTVFYLLQVYQDPLQGYCGFQLSESHNGFDTTKIGGAVIAAYPSRPSEADASVVTDFYGYPSVDEVARRAEEHHLPKLLSRTL